MRDACLQDALLDIEQMGGMHGVLTQPQSKEKPGEREVSRHFPAQSDRHLGFPGSFQHMREQREDSRMKRVVEVRDGVVRAIDCERVLDKVVGADRKKIELTREN